MGSYQPRSYFDTGDGRRRTTFNTRRTLGRLELAKDRWLRFAFCAFFPSNLLLTNTPTIGPLLLKNLNEAVDLVKQCESACADFEQHRAPDVIHEWKMMKLRWEKDSSQPDPFKLVEKGMSVVQLWKEF